MCDLGSSRTVRWLTTTVFLPAGPSQVSPAPTLPTMHAIGAVRGTSPNSPSGLGTVRDVDGLTLGASPGLRLTSPGSPQQHPRHRAPHPSPWQSEQRPGTNPRALAAASKPSAPAESTPGRAPNAALARGSGVESPEKHREHCLPSPHPPIQPCSGPRSWRGPSQVPVLVRAIPPLRCPSLLLRMVPMRKCGYCRAKGG